MLTHKIRTMVFPTKLIPRIGSVLILVLCEYKGEKYLFLGVQTEEANFICLLMHISAWICTLKSFTSTSYIIL